uniref:Uncharacterized protein n=1 Tax=Faxonius propinquus nudivirus TaxID=3139431 RepID=A0AAU8GC22_9VIRU
MTTENIKILEKLLEEIKCINESDIHDFIQTFNYSLNNNIEYKQLLTNDENQKCMYLKEILQQLNTN